MLLTLIAETKHVCQTTVWTEGNRRWGRIDIISIDVHWCPYVSFEFVFDLLFMVHLYICVVCDCSCMWYYVVMVVSWAFPYAIDFK